MPTTPQQPSAPRTRGWALVGLILMVLLGLLYVFGAANDLRADASGDLPVDHTATFSELAGSSFAQTKDTAPGTARYTTLLERGYAVHELTFAFMFLVLLIIPFRRRQRWAWWAAWIPMIANLGYTLTFGVHDPTILYRSLIADIALPVLQLAHIPAFFPRSTTPTGKP